MHTTNLPSKNDTAATSALLCRPWGMRKNALGLVQIAQRPGHVWKIATLASVFLLAACGQDNRYVAPPAPKVAVAAPIERPVTRYLEATGSTAAVNSADLVARVSGFIQEINYREGTPVKKGTLLFTIEPEPYQVRLQQAEAAEASSEATLKQLEAELVRQTELLAKQTTSQQKYDQALANRDTARANLRQAQANTRLAALNYEYAHVRAPFDGIVAARQVSVGQFVGGGTSPTVLASIVQLDPIYVNFNISEQDVLRIRANMERRGLTPRDLRQVPVELGLQTESGYPHRGTLDYASPTVTQSTGTLASRAVLQNEKVVLLPGYFVRVRVPLGQRDNALLVPDTAIGSDQSGRYVLVVDKDDVVVQRKVELGPKVDALRVIDGGLKSDDRVVIGGALRAIPGQKVNPQMQPATAESAGLSGAQWGVTP